jgi:small subunit ribosomal protein S6
LKGKMAARPYELMLLLSPAVDEEGVTNTVNRVNRLITQGGGAVTSQDRWGLRRLAYPIRHFKEGNYILTRCTLDPQKASEVEKGLHVTEEVLRHLLVRVDQ